MGQTMILQMSDYRPSPESIAHAREAMIAERKAAGVWTVEIACLHCTFVVDGCGLTEGIAEGKAIKELSRHILAAHGGQS